GLRAQRLASMLFFSWWPNGGEHESIQQGLAHLWSHRAVKAEALELLALARDRISHVPQALRDDVFVDVPLWLHCRYSRDALLAGLGHASLQRKPNTDREGVRYVEPLNTDVFTFSLQKSEREYSPTTMYKDYAISRDLVHWETQSATSVASAKGQR